MHGLEVINGMNKTAVREHNARTAKRRGEVKAAIREAARDVAMHRQIIAVMDLAHAEREIERLVEKAPGRGGVL